MKSKIFILLVLLYNIINAYNIKTYNNDIQINKIFHNKVSLVKKKEFYQLLNIKYEKNKINQCSIYDNILHCDNNETIILIKNNNNIFPIKIINNNSTTIFIKQKNKNINLKKIKNNKEKQKKKTLKNKKLQKNKKENYIIENILKGF